MARQFTVHAAKTNLSKLIDAAPAGEEIVIAKGSKPVVKLVAIQADKFKIGLLQDQLGSPGPNFFEPMAECKTWSVPIFLRYFPLRDVTVMPTMGNAGDGLRQASAHPTTEFTAKRAIREQRPARRVRGPSSSGARWPFPRHGCVH